MLRTPFQLPPQGLLCHLLLHVLILCVHFEVMLCISAASHSPVERHGKAEHWYSGSLPEKPRQVTITDCIKASESIHSASLYSVVHFYLSINAASIGNILYLDSSQRQSCTQHSLCIQLADNHLCSPHSQYSG